MDATTSLLVAGRIRDAHRRAATDRLARESRLAESAPQSWPDSIIRLRFARPRPHKRP